MAQYKPGTWKRGESLSILNEEVGYPVYTFALEDSGDYLVCGQQDLFPHLWDIPNKVIIHEFEPRIGEDYGNSTRCCKFSPDNKSVLAGMENGKLYLWDAKTGSQIHVFEGHNAGVIECDFSPDGKYIISVSRDGVLCLWNVALGTPISGLNTNTPIHCCSIKSSGDRTIIAIGDNARTINIFHLENY